MPIRKQRSEGLEPGEVITNDAGEIVDPNTGEVLLDAPSRDVSVKRLDVSVYTSDELANIKSFDEALALAQAVEADWATDVLGDGYQPLEDKSELIDRPFVLLDWRFSYSNEIVDQNGNAALFVIAKGIAQGDQKFLMTDGSTGICKSLREFSERGGKPPLPSNGLKKSTYRTTDRLGNPVSGTTFWII